jgi:hypothetical protein
VNLRAISVDASTPPAEEHDLDISGEAVVALRLRGRVKATSPPSTWPYSDFVADPAIPRSKATGPDVVDRAIEVRATPYYAWGNRGATSMRVWVPRHS